jgi:hypothetical protein
MPTRYLSKNQPLLLTGGLMWVDYRLPQEAELEELLLQSSFSFIFPCVSAKKDWLAWAERILYLLIPISSLLC